MKTAAIMYRDLNGVSVRQNHKTGFFNANDLLEIYNKSSKKQKDLYAYTRSKQFKEFRSEILKDIFQNTQNLRVLNGAEESEKNGAQNLEEFVCQVKRGKHGGTWLHPYLFMDFAMWLSPEFKLKCVKWIYDNLIKFRDECGDGFKEVNKALQDKSLENNKVVPHYVYSNEANMINKLVFGSMDKGQRDFATEHQLELLKSLQKADAKLIHKGYDYYERYERLKELKNYL